MTETVLNRSPLAPAKPRLKNRWRVRAAECVRLGGSHLLARVRIYGRWYGFKNEI